MNEVAEMFLEIFKEFKTPKNGMLMMPQIMSQVKEWEKKEQVQMQKAAGELISGGFIRQQGNRFYLTEKGYNQLYSDATINDTVDIILNIFSDEKADIGTVITIQKIQSEIMGEDQIHRAQFSKALASIQSDGFLSTHKRGLELTKKGYNKIYEIEEESEKDKDEKVTAESNADPLDSVEDDLDLDNLDMDDFDDDKKESKTEDDTDDLLADVDDDLDLDDLDFDGDSSNKNNEEEKKKDLGNADDLNLDDF